MRVRILEVSIWISWKVVWFSIRFSSLLLYSVQQHTVATVRGCVSLKKYKSQGKAVEMTLNSKEENY
jgi:hypothetical protein